MSKKSLSESDICDRFITPSLVKAGWDQSRWRREYAFTDGRIIVRGKLVARGKQKRVDLTGLSGLDGNSLRLLVSTLQLFGQPAGRNRQDEVTSRLLEVGRALPANGTAILMAPSFYRTFRIGHLYILTGNL